MIRVIVLCLAATVAAACATLPGDIGSVLGRSIHVTADFDSVAGLYVGNEVAVLGLPVGEVTAIDPKGDYVQVAMRVDGDVPVPADAMAALISPQLITNRHVELNPGYSGNGPTLTDGAHIPLARTRTPVELDRILRNFEELGAALRGSAIDGPMASRVLYPLLDGNGDRIRETLDALASAFEVSLANTDQISNTITKLTEITTVLAENDTTVREFSARLTELITLMADQAPGLRAVLAQIDAFVTNTSAVVAENRVPLTAALNRLTTITAQMQSNARGLTEVVDVAPLFFENFANAVSTENRALRLHLLTDKSLLDNELLALFCERVQMRSDGCRTGKLADFGPDLGLTLALTGLLR